MRHLLEAELTGQNQEGVIDFTTEMDVEDLLPLNKDPAEAVIDANRLTMKVSSVKRHFDKDGGVPKNWVIELESATLTRSAAILMTEGERMSDFPVKVSLVSRDSHVCC